MDFKGFKGSSDDHTRKPNWSFTRHLSDISNKTRNKGEKIGDYNENDAREKTRQNFINCYKQVKQVSTLINAYESCPELVPEMEIGELSELYRSTRQLLTDVDKLVSGKLFPEGAKTNIEIFLEENRNGMREARKEMHNYAYGPYSQLATKLMDDRLQEVAAFAQRLKDSGITSVEAFKQNLKNRLEKIEERVRSKREKTRQNFIDCYKRVTSFTKIYNSYLELVSNIKLGELAELYQSTRQLLTDVDKLVSDELFTEGAKTNIETFLKENQNGMQTAKKEMDNYKFGLYSQQRVEPMDKRLQEVAAFARGLKDSGTIRSLSDIAEEICDAERHRVLGDTEGKPLEEEQWPIHVAFLRHVKDVCPELLQLNAVLICDAERYRVREDTAGKPFAFLQHVKDVSAEFQLEHLFLSQNPKWICNAERRRVLDYTRNKYLEEQWATNRAFLQCVKDVCPELLPENAELVYNAERKRVLGEEGKPLEEPWELCEKWLSTIPQEDKDVQINEIIRVKKGNIADSIGKLIDELRRDYRDQTNGGSGQQGADTGTWSGTERTRVGEPETWSDTERTRVEEPAPHLPHQPLGGHYPNGISITGRYIDELKRVDKNGNTHYIQEKLANIGNRIVQLEVGHISDRDISYYYIQKDINDSIQSILKSARDNGSPQIWTKVCGLLNLPPKLVIDLTPQEYRNDCISQILYAGAYIMRNKTKNMSHEERRRKYKDSIDSTPEKYRNDYISQLLYAERDRMQEKTKDMSHKERWREYEDSIDSTPKKYRNDYIFKLLYAEADRMRDKTKDMSDEERWREYEDSIDSTPKKYRNDYISQLLYAEVDRMRDKTKDMSHKERWREYEDSIDSTPKKYRNDYISQLLYAEVDRMRDKTKDMSHKERWREYEDSIDSTPKKYRNDYISQLLYAEVGRMQEKTKDMSHKERWREYEDSIDSTPEKYRNDYIFKLLYAEADRMRDKTKDMSHKERWEEYRASIEAAPDAHRERYAISICSAEADRMRDKTKDMSHKERWEEYRASIEAAPDAHRERYAISICMAEAGRMRDNIKDIMSHKERWKEYRASIKAAPDAHRERYAFLILEAEAKRMLEQTKGMSHKERWEEYQASIEAASGSYGEYYAVLIFGSEAGRILEQTKGNSHEERWKEYQASIKAAPDAYQENYAKNIISVEIAMIQENTREMPIDERRKAKQDWLEWIPEKYKKGDEIMEVINEQEHIERVETLIRDKKLNMDIPDQNTKEWNLYSSILLELYQDEKGYTHFDYLKDILNGGKDTGDGEKDTAEKWHERRNSEEYKNLMVWVLEKWRDRNEEKFIQIIASSKVKDALESFDTLEAFDASKVSKARALGQEIERTVFDKSRWKLYQNLIESAPNDKYKEKYVQKILEAETNKMLEKTKDMPDEEKWKEYQASIKDAIDALREKYAISICMAEVSRMLDNTKGMSEDEQGEAQQAWLSSVVPDEYRPKCIEIIAEETRRRELNKQ